MSVISLKIQQQWEANYPAVFGGVGAVLALAFSPHVFAIIADRKWTASAIYSSMFDLSAIATAFLFTFYTFVATTDRGFIGRAKDSLPYRMTIRYAVVAMILGAVVTLFSIAMMIMTPTPTEWAGWRYYIVAIWTGVTAAALAAFVRSTYLFWIFAANHR